MDLQTKRLHSIWRGITKRCYDSNHNSFRYYGAKGIVMCEEWKNDFNSFRDWALSNGYGKKLTIDRVDSGTNYSPENCRWVTQRENLKNRKGKNSWIMVKINDFELCLADWAKVAGISKTAIYKRFKKGIRGFDLIKPATR